MHYIKNKREQISKCNICCCEDKMTWDHVPPKGAILINDIEMVSIMNSITLPNPEDQPFLQSQNGMKFRTICAKCNNTLGQKYDKEFNNAIALLTRALVGNDLNACTALVDTEKMLKSICGHLLAAKLDFEETVPDQKMRNFVLGRSHELGLGVYYWYYPYLENMVLRDLVISRFTKNQNAMVSIIKCFPIAVLITDAQIFESEFTKLGVSDNIIELILQPAYPADYPIHVTDETMILGGQSMNSALIARPKNNR